MSDHKGVKIVAHANVPGRLAGNASELYSRNIFNFISAFYDAEGAKLAIDWDDEIIAGIGLTRDGAIVHPALAAPVAKGKNNGEKNAS